MSDQRPTIQYVSLSKKQRIGQYAAGCGIGLFPLWLGLLNVIFPCYLPLAALLYPSFFYFLGDILTTFGLLWFPRVRFLGLGFLTSVVLLFVGLPIVFGIYWKSCVHFVF